MLYKALYIFNFALVVQLGIGILALPDNFCAFFVAIRCVSDYTK